MVSKKWLSWIKGNDKVIIQLLEKQSSNLVVATNYLIELVLESQEKNICEEKVSQIKNLEHEGDHITHSLFTTLFQTFVTTLDREDIAGLASAIDEVLDYTEGIADRFLLFKMRNPTIHMINLSKILHSATEEIHVFTKILSETKNVSALIPHCNSLKNYEQQADNVYRRAIAELFETNSDAIEVIKFKEIYEIFESSLDKCQDVADIVEDIVLKYG
ncbi:phosphate transport regulator [Candidatus Nitrosocosmicus sp.]|nr:phosphate transport regulator [Candidatus Nitrosocosmicus sp.]